MKYVYTLFILISICTVTWSQLSPGSTAPNFTLTDIDGNTHTLYDYLDQGKTVVLNFGATWCGPCWNYLNAGGLTSFYNTYGPNGSNESMVLWIESDLSTGMADLLGNTGSSQGNWIANTPYPIIDLTSDATSNDYNIGYYPTIYKVCPDYTVYEVGQVGYQTFVNWIQSCTLEAQVEGVQGTTCYGLGQGSASASANGGYGTTNFIWSDGSFGPIMDGVEAGTYELTVSDANGRQIFFDNIDIPGPLTPIEITNSSVTDLLCFGDASGNISVDVTGGNGGFIYDWNNGATGNIIGGLDGGTYNLTITDANGCTHTGSYEVFEPTELMMTTASFEDHCNQSIGEIIVFPDGGIPDYDISATAGSVVGTQVLQLPQGAHTVSVIDANGCIAEESIFIDNIPGPDVTFTLPPPLTCENQTAVLDPFVDYPYLSDLIYSWSTNDGNIISGQFDAIVTVDQPGTYTLFIDDLAYGCNWQGSVIVEGNLDLPTVDAGADRSIDCNNLLLEIESSLGNLPDDYTITWSTEAGNILSGQGTADIQVDAPGIYSIQVVNNENGCSATDNVTITDNRSYPEADYTLEKEYLVVQFSDGSSGEGITYHWDFGDGSSSTEPSPQHTFPIAGTYEVCLTVENGCGSSEYCINILVESEPSAISIEVSSTNITCFGFEDGTVTAIAQGGSGNYLFEWVGPDGFTASGTSLSQLVPGNYILTVMDDEGNQAQVQVTITEPDSMETSLELNQSFGGPTLTAGSNGGTPGYDYLWSNGSTAPTLINVPSGTYSFTVTDMNGCSAESESVRVINPTDIAEDREDFDIHISGNASFQPLVISVGNTTPRAKLRFQVVTVMGHIVASGAWQGDQTTIDLHEQIPGLYFLIVSDLDGVQTVTRRIVIQE